MFLLTCRWKQGVGTVTRATVDDECWDVCRRVSLPFFFSSSESCFHWLKRWSQKCSMPWWWTACSWIRFMLDSLLIWRHVGNDLINDDRQLMGTSSEVIFLQAFIVLGLDAWNLLSSSPTLWSHRLLIVCWRWNFSFHYEPTCATSWPWNEQHHL